MVHKKQLLYTVMQSIINVNFRYTNKLDNKVVKNN